MYNSLFQPHSNYCLLAWGYNPGHIFKLQKKVIRLVCKTKYNAHTDPLFKQLNILKLSDLLNYRCLQFYNKYLNLSLPTYFANMFAPLPIHHDFFTRNINEPQYRQPSKTTSCNVIWFKIPNLLKDTPSCITNKFTTHRSQGISRYINYVYVNQYEVVCTKRNCFSCNS